MSPAPVASTAQVPGKDVRWLGGIHGVDILRRSPKEMHLPNTRGETGWREGKDGEVAEWLKAHAWKVCLRETVTRVRIPLSPPTFIEIPKSQTACRGISGAPALQYVWQVARFRVSGVLSGLKFLNFLEQVFHQQSINLRQFRWR